MKKPWVRILIAVVVVLVIAVLLVPFFVNANSFRPALEARLSQTLGRKVTLGNLSFSLLSGSVVADDITIADDPAFGAAPFLETKSLHVGVEILPFLLHRQLRVTKIVLNDPSINLVHASNGTWNFSSIGRQASAAPAQNSQAESLPNLTIAEIRIEGGNATVSNLPASGQPLVYSNLSLAVQQFSFVKSFPFQVSADLPAGGSLSVAGNAGPFDQKDASNTPLQAKISVKHFDPVACGVLEPSEGIAGLLDIEATVSSNGQTAASSGTVHAQHLKLVASGSPAPQPVDLSYSVDYNLAARSGQVNQLKVVTGAVGVQAQGTYQIDAQQTNVNLKVSAPNLPVDQVETLLPAVGVRLPSGSSLQGGTINADLAVTGPVNALTISGPVSVSNTRLAGFDLGSKIGGLNPIGGSQGGTAIQTLRANVTSSPSGTQIANLFVSVPAIGTASGGGTVSPAGGLNFNVTAMININSGVSSQALGGLSVVGASLGQVVDTALRGGVPVLITGTTSNPIIRADLSKVLERNAGNIVQQQLKHLDNGQQNPAGLLNRFLPH